MSYVVQWRYKGSARWYGYGADRVTPSTQFESLDEARDVFQRMVDTYYAHYYRIMDDGENIVVPEVKGKVMWKDGVLIE